MGQTATQTKYLTKVVLFNGQKMTLFSLDGNTWSTRKVELAEIKQRHELQRAELAGKKEELEAAALPGAEPAKLLDDDIDPEDAAEYEAPIPSSKGRGDDDSEPFSISDLDEDEDSSATNAKVKVKAKPAKLHVKLPKKPIVSAFNKNAKKPDVKISKKGKDSIKPAVGKEKAKKAVKLKIAKPSPSKNSKNSGSKKRKAA